MYGRLCKAGNEEKAIQISTAEVGTMYQRRENKAFKDAPVYDVHELVDEIIKRKIRKSYEKMNLPY